MSKKITRTDARNFADFIMICWVLVGIGVWIGSGSFGYGLAASAFVALLSLAFLMTGNPGHTKKAE